MMPRRSGLSPSSTVLRGVLLHGQPHALARPGRLHAEPLARISHAEPAHGMPNPAADAASSDPAAFEAGLAQGRKEGAEAAMAQMAEEVQARKQDLMGLRELAAAEGRMEGIAQGREEALAAASQARAQAMERADRAAADRLDRLDRLLESLMVERAGRLEEAEEDLVALSHLTVCRILGAEAIQPERVRSMVMHLLAQEGQRTQLAVHVHPDDLGALVNERGTAETPWRWVGDAAVQLGGVVLRSPEGSLDARLETQLAALREALLTSRRDRKFARLQETSEANAAGQAI